MTTPSVRDASDSITERAPARSRWQLAVGVLGLVVVFWVGDRLYTVIDAGGMGPGGDHEPVRPATTQPGDTEPTGGRVEHDPSQFDH